MRVGICRLRNLQSSLKVSYPEICPNRSKQTSGNPENLSENQPDRKTNSFFSEMFFGRSSDTLSTRAYAGVMTRRYEMYHNSSKRRSANPDTWIGEVALMPSSTIGGNMARGPRSQGLLLRDFLDFRTSVWRYYGKYRTFSSLWQRRHVSREYLNYVRKTFLKTKVIETLPSMGRRALVTCIRSCNAPGEATGEV